MFMTPTTEKLCYEKRAKVIQVDATTRACVNCIYYEPYFRENRGNVRGFVQLAMGNCLLHDCQRGALRRPCKDYETKEDNK